MLAEAVQWYIFIGILLVSVSACGPLLANNWFAPVHLQLLGGIVVGPWCLGLLELNLLTHSEVLEVASEIAVIISLYAAGIKMRIPLASGRWKAPVLLASVTMMVTIGLTAAVATWIFGLSLPGAILLGAALAPTDPVLANKIQVERASDDDRLRQSLTGESGLNDGTAFPFVLLAIGLSDPRLHSLGRNFENWVLIDLLWKVTGGLLFGALAGFTLGKTILWLRARHESEKNEASGAEELLTMGLISVVYGVALALNTYAFLAVFAAAVFLRRIEMFDTRGEVSKPEADELDEHDPNASSQVALLREQTAVGSSLERVAQVFLVVVIGVLLSTERLFNWQAWLFAFVMIGCIRPAAVLTTLYVRSITTAQRNLIAWFGIRGIGTLYYLAHAVSSGVDASLSEEIATIIDCCVVTITLSIVLHGTTDTPLMNWYAAHARSEQRSRPAQAA